MRTSRLVARLFPGAALLAGLGLSLGCGGGGGGGGTADAGGTVDFAVTDSPSETLDLFEVDVRSLRLHRTDGAVVETLSRTARVDFADLVALSDLLTVATVPSGVYDRVGITLDFASAAVHLDGQIGMATVLDADGNAFTAPATLEIELPSDRPLVVAPGIPRFVEIDFDLDASTVVDAGANEVRVGAILYARVEPSDPKPLRSYGRLVDVDETASTFTFRILRRREFFGDREHDATTDADTLFDVDGTTARGAAGLALLAAKPAGTRLEIHGAFDPAARVFRARYVEAGRGVFDGTLDFVEGLVLARTGGAGADPVLTVRALGVDRGASVSFNRTFTVNASFADTKVVRQRDDASHDTDDVNVGQRVVAFGALTGAVLDATVPGENLVRMLETGISGLASGAVSGGVLTADIRHIGRRPASAFDFTVGGETLADASALAIDVGTMTLPDVGAGSAIVALGFFVPVDASSSGPDFVAQTVIDRTNTASLLGVRWGTPTAAPFSAASAAGATVDLSAASGAKVDVGGVALIDLMGGADPQVVPAAAGGVFAVVEAASLTLYTDFALWLADVQGRLARSPGPALALDLGGIGKWDGAARTLTARRVSIRVR